MSGRPSRRRDPSRRPSRRRRRGLGVVAAALVAVGMSAAGTQAAASASGTGALTWNASLPAIASSYGSGDFGRWTVDRFGLPSYRYTLDQQTSPLAHQAELAGGTDAWSQVGNDRVKADAFNQGYTELWSQDRLAQWIDQLDPTNRHLGGGFGYLNVDGKVISTLYDDRPTGSSTERTFGVGYFDHSLETSGIEASEVVYAPFGNDPVLLHDVHITNTSSRSEAVSWFEYWDVNPLRPVVPSVPRPDRAGVVRQIPDALGGPASPRRGHRAALHLPGPAGGADDGVHHLAIGLLRDWQRRPSAGRGRRPARRRQRADRSRTAPRERRSSPCRVASAWPPAIPSPFATSTATTSPVRSLRWWPSTAAPRTRSPPSERRWVASLPKASFGSGREWLAREFLWDAYLLRSATVDEQAVRRAHGDPGRLLPVRGGRELGHPELVAVHRAHHLHGSRPGPPDRSSTRPSSSPGRRCNSPTGPPACARPTSSGSPTTSTSGSCGRRPPMDWRRGT